MGCPWPWAPPWPARTGRCSRCRPTAARCTRSRRCGRWPASSSTSPWSSATTAPTRSWRTSWRGWGRPRTASAPASCCTWAGRRWTSSRWPPAWACPRPGPRPPRSWPSSCARHSPRPARTWSTRCCPAAGEVAARGPLRRLVRAGLVVAVVLAVLTGLLWGLQRRLVYFPDDGPVPAAAAVLPGARDVVLETSDGLRLGAWLVPGPDPGAPAVLVADGNGGHRGLPAPLAAALARRGVAGLLFGYPGHRGQPPRPPEG